MKNLPNLYRLKGRVTRKLAGAVGLLLAICLVFSVLPSPVLAVPQPPNNFRGNVTINGGPAPAGLTVSARIGGTQFASTTTDALGRYGYSPLFNVPANDPATPAKEGGVAGETITFFVADNAATPTATFQSGGVTQHNLTVTLLTVTINQAAGQADPTNTSPINFTVVFNETVTDFATGDVTLSGTAGATTATVTGSGAAYNVAVSGMTSSGTVIASIPAGVCQDSIGETNAASTSTDNQVTYNTASQKLIGVDDTAPTGTAGAGYLHLDRFAAVATGTISQIMVKCTQSGSVKVGLYTDSGGSPGALLNANNSANSVVAGWNSISIPQTFVTSGTYYWIAFNSTGCIGYAPATGGAILYRVFNYADNLPDPAGSGFGTASNLHCLTAGWGTTTPPGTPTTLVPNIVCRWNAVATATSYWLQANTLPDFSGTNLFNADVGNVTSQTVTGLTSGTTVYWQVKAGNASGYGNWSVVRSVLCQ